MNGAIFYSGKHGSTAQYAQWIGEATGLPVFDANSTHGDPADYDFLILGSSVILMKMTIRKWIRTNWDGIEQKPTLLFSVAGVAADDPLLQSWLRASYPEELVKQAPHFGLGGRLDLSKFSWWMRLFFENRFIDKTDAGKGARHAGRVRPGRQGQHRSDRPVGQVISREIGRRRSRLTGNACRTIGILAGFRMRSPQVRFSGYKPAINYFRPIPWLDRVSFIRADVNAFRR